MDNKSKLGLAALAAGLFGGGGAGFSNLLSGGLGNIGSNLASNFGSLGNTLGITDAATGTGQFLDDAAAGWASPAPSIANSLGGLAKKGVSAVTSNPEIIGSAFQGGLGYLAKRDEAKAAKSIADRSRADTLAAIAKKEGRTDTYEDRFAKTWGS